MLKLGKINREKKCKIIQKSTMNNTRMHLLNGGIVSTDTLNSGAIMINIEDYNIKSMKVL